MGKNAATHRCPTTVSKGTFIKLFETVLKNANAGIEALELADENTALVIFVGGASKRVNITGDSHMAIMWDILEAIK